MKTEKEVASDRANGRVELLICMECGGEIDPMCRSLCGYTCESDNIHISERNPESVRVAVYKFYSLQPYTGKVGERPAGSETHDNEKEKEEV